MDLVVQARVNIEASKENDFKRMPFNWAEMNCSCNAIVALLRHKANVDTHYVDGWRPLDIACGNFGRGGSRPFTKVGR